MAHCLNEFKAKFAFFVAHIQASGSSCSPAALLLLCELRCMPTRTTCHTVLWPTGHSSLPLASLLPACHRSPAHPHPNWLFPLQRMDTLFEASFSPLASSGKVLSQCGKCRRYMKLIASRPSRLYCPTCEDVYNMPQVRHQVEGAASSSRCIWRGVGRESDALQWAATRQQHHPPTHPACHHPAPLSQGGSIKLYKELACPLDGFQLLLFSLGGAGAVACGWRGLRGCGMQSGRPVQALCCCIMLRHAQLSPCLPSWTRLEFLQMARRTRCAHIAVRIRAVVGSLEAVCGRTQLRGREEPCTFSPLRDTRNLPPCTTHCSTTADNHPPFEDAPRLGDKASGGMPCTLCTHPTCRHSVRRHLAAAAAG